MDDVFLNPEISHINLTQFLGWTGKLTHTWLKLESFDKYGKQIIFEMESRYLNGEWKGLWGQAIHKFNENMNCFAGKLSHN